MKLKLTKCMNLDDYKDDVETIKVLSTLDKDELIERYMYRMKRCFWFAITSLILNVLLICYIL